MEAQRTSLENRQPDGILWLLWALATGGGALTGGIVVSATTVVAPQTLWIVLTGPVAGLAVGLAQLLALRRYLHGFGWRGWLLIHSKARAAIRLITKRLLRPKLVEFFQVSPSL